MMCKGKQCYSEQKARQMRKTIGNHRNKKLRIYQCDVCHHYHLTSSIDDGWQN